LKVYKTCAGLTSRGGLTLNILINLDGEIRAQPATNPAASAFIGSYDDRQGISLGSQFSLSEADTTSGTEMLAQSTTSAALFINKYLTLCHISPFEAVTR
jgi:hypothetical protein